MFGDFEFLLNDQYLELNIDRMLGVFFIPYMVPIYQLLYLPVMLVWAFLTLVWIVGQIIVVAIYTETLSEED